MIRLIDFPRQVVSLSGDLFHLIDIPKQAVSLSGEHVPLD